MLTQSKTKFSYARRLFALPILFILTFAYLVNAKNREIKETNLEIEKYIAASQIDTVIAKPAAPPEAPPAPPVPPVPPVPKALEDEIKLKEKQLKPMNEAIVKKSAEAQKIGAELRLKNIEMEKLAAKNDFDSPKFRKLEKEMNQLSEKMENIFNADDFKINMKKLELEHAEMDKLYAQLDKFYNSEDFKLKIKAAEDQAEAADKIYNSPEFRKNIKDAEKHALEMERKVNSPAFRKKIEEAEKRAKEAEKQINSPEFQQRIKDAENAARNAGKNASTLEKDVKIFVDGKLLNKAEMKEPSPDRIEKVQVFKKGHNGSTTNEIHITTKK